MDRILDVTDTVEPSTRKTIKHYLVKWKALAYEDSTWELEDDVDPLKVRCGVLGGCKWSSSELEEF